MNMEDIIDPEYGLQQDEWSLSKPVFGVEGQLTVVGWSGKYGSNKAYIVRCSICSQDKELYGEGFFKSVKNNSEKIIYPCGCSRSPKWSKEQYRTLCKRAASKLNNTFIDFSGEWLGSKTKVLVNCPSHGNWDTGSICNLLRNRGCPVCKYANNAIRSKKPDSEMIDSFFASGAFHPDTKFWRSKRKTQQGVASYWHIYCPVCGETGESVSSNLQEGKICCACSKHDQKQGYINWVIDCNNVIVAIKFGIARNSRQRLKQQNSRSAYGMEQISVYEFPNVWSCKKAERECLQQIECGVVLKRDMFDGYTETTWVYNLDKIIEIYELNGGIKIEDID